MLLAIDVGNTNMVFTVFREEEVIGSFRLMTDADRTSDEIGLYACEYFQRFGLQTNEVEDVVIASVVPQIMYTLTSAIIKYFEKTPLIIGEDIQVGLPYGVDGDERLGSDRSVACVAAIEKYGAPLIVLDFGTATTLDIINPQGAYIGGCIMAGVRISAEALVHKTAMLPKVELAMPATVLGASTVEQIQAGAVMGYLGAVEFLIRRARQEMPGGEVAQVVATGGLARLIADSTDLVDAVESQLVLDGLRLLYQRYRNGKN